MYKRQDEDGIDHFYEHPQVGAKKTKTILRRLKFDNATIDIVCRLVAIHDINPALTPESVRKAIQKAGLECYPVIFELKKADILAQSDYQRKEKLEALDGYHKIYDKIIEDADCLTQMCIRDRGLLEFIAGLKKQGKKLAVVSSTSTRLIVVALNRMKMLGLFDVVVCGDMCRNRKPDPECYRTVSYTHLDVYKRQHSGRG